MLYIYSKRNLKLNRLQWRIQDLTLGGRGLSQRGVGRRKSLKVLKVEVKVIIQRVWAIFLLKLCLKVIASEASDEKIAKN